MAMVSGSTAHIPALSSGIFAVLEPVRDYKARHASTLLTFDAVVAAIDQIAAKRAAAPAGAAFCHSLISNTAA